MKPEKKRANRSDSYQWIINEIPVDVDILSTYSNGQGYQGALNPFQYDERYLDLEDKLKARTRELMALHLTERQKAIIDLYYEGLTQSEIAEKLGCNQSSVTKSLNGNRDYSKDSTKVYGGSTKKLKKLFHADPEIKQILEEMRELIEEVL